MLLYILLGNSYMPAAFNVVSKFVYVAVKLV